MEVVNSTPWRTAWTMALDSAGYETITLVVKATYTLLPGIAPSEEPVDVVIADEFHDDPAWSSVKNAGDMALSKAATDVFVFGHVYPLRRDATRGGARLRCGRIDKTVAVAGNRVWQPSGLAFAPSSPQAFEKLPLRYEHAYGGKDALNGQMHAAFENPAGIGFRAPHSKRAIAGAPVANIEHPQQPMRDPNHRPPVMGLGPLACHWLPRRSYAGTYGPAWERDQAPLLPHDFDVRFHQQAPADQIYLGYVQGGESVQVQGMRTEGPLDFALPSVRPEIAFRYRGHTEERTPPCDTVIVDADKAQLCMVFRASTRVHGRLGRLAFMGVRLRD